MSKSKKLNCYSPQCSYWDENQGCRINEDAGNGKEPCDRCEERYENQVFIIVKGGMVLEIYSDKAPSDLHAEVLDLDNAHQNPDNKTELEETRKRIKEISEKYHQII